jgi:hypothetical protein
MLDKTTKTIFNYTVEALSDEKGKVAYHLHGVRGALYGLIRSVNDPSSMFAVNSRGKVCGVAGNYWFSDRNGTLTTIN